MELKITGLSNGSEGIARSDEGKTVFVEGGVPGDLVQVEIMEEKSRFARARITEVLESSSHRVNSPCPHFSRCGGCSWGHISYGLQLTAKRDNVVQQLTRIGGFDKDLIQSLAGETLPSPKTYGYRNKIELRTSMSSGSLELGYTASDGTTIIPVDQCPLAAGRARKAPRALRGALRYLAGSHHDLGIERVSIRYSDRTDDLEIAIWTPPSSFPRNEAARILKDALSPTSTVRVILKSSAEKRSIAKVETLGGKGYWRERLSGFSHQVSAPSFFQVNTDQAEALVDITKAHLENCDLILDLYSGIGTFTLPLLADEKDVISVESYGPAVRDQRRTIEASGYDAEVVGGDVERELEDLLADVDGVIVDPPRTGLASPVSQLIRGCNAERLVYVSCDPATLARDLKVICSTDAWKIDAVKPVDMFPQTHHVETVVLMSRNI